PVNKIDTRMNLTASPQTAPYGTPVTLVANVFPTIGNGVPTGLVTFKQGNTTLGTAQLDGTGTAKFPLPTATPPDLGSHTYTAVYAGDGLGYNGSTNDTTLQITIAQTTTVVTGSKTTLIY